MKKSSIRSLPLRAAAAEAAVVDALLAAETVGDLKAMPQTDWLKEEDG